ncbi:MAG: serine hydrolase domain-containing protein, partial [Pseudomonadota bacterium]
AVREADGSFSRADDGVRPLYSITKTFIAAAIDALAVDETRPASDWFEESWLPRGREISVRQLLTHSSGLRDYGALPAYAEAITSGEPVWSDSSFAEQTLMQPLLFEPGTSFSYSNPGYWLLKRIIEIESDLPFAQALERLLFAPMKLESLSVADGVFAEDLPHYPSGWVWHGLILGTPADVAEFMASAAVSALYRNAVAVPGKHPGWQAPHYAHGLMTEPGTSIGHNGGGPGYSAACHRNLQNGRVACVLARAEQDLTETALQLAAGLA